VENHFKQDLLYEMRGYVVGLETQVKIYVQYLKGGDHLVALGIDWWIILKHK
jgi:hypothetical protein